MVPQSMGNGTERGYYIFFDIKQWHRERVSISSSLVTQPAVLGANAAQREFTLIYDDLENPSLPNALPRALV